MVEATVFAAAPTLLLALILFGLRRELRENWRAVLFLALAVLVFFRRTIFLPEMLSQSDANLLQLQFFSVYREAITGGAAPFWNHYQGAGLPNLAHPLSAMWYPLTPLFLVGSVFKAMGLFVALHFFLAGLFALLLGRRIFRSGPAALTFALLWAFNGWAVTRAAHQPAIEYLFAYAWLPMAALFFERALDGKRLLSCAAGAGAALAWMGITCPNFFVHACILMGAAGILRVAWLLAGGRRNAAALALFVIFTAGSFAVALSAVEIVPAFELSLLSTGGRLGEVLPEGWRGRALSGWEIIRMYFPYAPARPFAVYYSPGVLALAAALYALYRTVRCGTRRALTVSAAAIIVLGAALASKGPLYEGFTWLFGLYARASLVPAGLLLLFAPVLVLAALGVEAFIEGRRRLLGRWGWLLALVIFAELFTVFSLIYPRRGERRLTYDYRAEVADFPHLDEIAERRAPGRTAVHGPREGHVVAPSYAMLERGLWRLNLNESMFAPDLMAETISLVTADMYAADIEVLGVGSVASTTDIPGAAPAVLVPWPGCMDHFENSLWWPLRNRPAWLAWDRNVRLYRVSDEPGIFRLKHSETLEGVLAGETGYPGYFDSWELIRAERVSPNRLEIDIPPAASAKGEGAVVFAAVTGYPGWRWRADGEDADWEIAGGGCMAARIEEGAGRLELSFRPTRWWLSLTASLGAILFALGAAILDERHA